MTMLPDGLSVYNFFTIPTWGDAAERARQNAEYYFGSLGRLVFLDPYTDTPEPMHPLELGAATKLILDALSQADVVAFLTSLDTLEGPQLCVAIGIPDVRFALHLSTPKTKKWFGKTRLQEAEASRKMLNAFREVLVWVPNPKD